MLECCGRNNFTRHFWRFTRQHYTFTRQTRPTALVYLFMRHVTRSNALCWNVALAIISLVTFYVLLINFNDLLVTFAILLVNFTLLLVKPVPHP